MDDTTSVGAKRILRSYITIGYGREIQNDYWAAGVGWFLPLGENILMGIRANANFELNLFKLKTPSESIWDVDLTIKYIPFISERFFFSIGAGAGFSKATKRGKFIQQNLLVTEHEKVISLSVSLLGEIEANLLITENIGINVISYALFADNRTFITYQIGIFLCKILTLK
ncbi:MAG: hypothetical protein PVF17_04890 [Ignavibacteria bacterium]